MASLDELLRHLSALSGRSRSYSRLDPKHAFVSTEQWRWLDVPEGWIVCAGPKARLSTFEAEELFLELAAGGAPVVGLNLGEEEGVNPDLLELLHFYRGAITESGGPYSSSPLKVLQCGLLNLKEIGALGCAQLRSLHGRAYGSDFTELARAPALSELFELALRGVELSEDVEEWATGGRTAHVRTLELTTDDIDQYVPSPAAAALVQADFRALRSLKLDGYHLEAEAVYELFTNPTLSELRQLSLLGAGLSPETIEELGRTPLALRLSMLEIDVDFPARAGLTIRRHARESWPSCPTGRQALAHRIEVVYGCSLSPKIHRIEKPSWKQPWLTCKHVPTNLMRHVLAENQAHSDKPKTELFGLLTNTLYLETFNLSPPQEDGMGWDLMEWESRCSRWAPHGECRAWRQGDSYRFAGQETFRERGRRAIVLCSLLEPGHAEAGFKAWLRELDGEPPEEAMERAYTSINVGCAEALQALWFTFFLSDDHTLRDLMAGLHDHPSLAVRHTIELLCGAPDYWRKVLTENQDIVRQLHRPNISTHGFEELVSEKIIYYSEKGRGHLVCNANITNNQAIEIFKTLGGRVIGLDFSGPCDDSLRSLAGSTEGQWVKQLDIEHCTPRTVEIIRLFPALEALVVGSPLTTLSSQLTATNLKVLAGLSSPLREFCVYSAPIGDGGFEILATAPPFATIENLALLGLRCSAVGLQSWARSGRTAELNALTVEFDPDTENFSAIRELLGAPFDRLESLSLSGKGLADESAVALAQNPRLTSLRRLRLTGRECRLGPAGVSSLANCPRLGLLEELELSGRAGGLGARAVVSSPYLRGLKSLALEEIGDEGARVMARYAQFYQLSELDLAHGGLTSDGLLSLLDGSLLNTVQVLSLYDNGIDWAAVDALLKNPQLGKLQKLYLDESLIGQRMTSRPGLTIEFC